MGQLTRSGGLALLIWRAQGQLCPICGLGLEREWMNAPEPDRAWSVEHVWPRRRYRFGTIGNQLISHVECNNRKGDRLPTGCEQIMLAAVNAQVGHRLKPLPHHDPGPIVQYADQISAPSALALALGRAGLA